MPARRKISLRQQEIIVEYMETHPDIALGRFPSGPQSSQVTRRTWESLAFKLNAVADGVTKTPDQWRRYWIEFKAKIKAKAADTRRKASATGGGPSKLVPLSAHEERVLAIIGSIAVEGLPGVRIPINIPSTSEASSIPTPNLTTPPPQPTISMVLPISESVPSELEMTEEWLDDIHIDPSPDPPTFSSTAATMETAQSEVPQEEHGEVVVDTGPQSSSQPARLVRDSRPARRPLRRILREERIPRWAHELELRRLGIEERHAEALERIAVAIENINLVLRDNNDRRPSS